MQRSFLTAPALSLVFATLLDELASSLQIEQSALSGAEIVELDDKGDAVPGEASCRVELCLEKGPSFMYGREDLSPPKAKEMGSKKMKLSFSMISIGKKERKPQCAVKATKNPGCEQLKLRRWMRRR